MSDNAKRTVVVIGGSRGIGKNREVHQKINSINSNAISRELNIFFILANLYFYVPYFF